MTTLIKYETARHALAEAHRVDEAKDIRDKAVAMEVYAKQAKDRQLLDMATDIKLRAERRVGELLREMPKNQGAIPGKTGRATRPVLDTTPKLSDIGITKDESSRWQKLAAMPEKQFEEKLAGVKSAMQAKTEGARPRSAGRKGTAKPRNKDATDDKRRELAAEVLDHGKTVKAAAIDAGVSEQIIKTSVEREKGRREAEPTITPDMLSMTAQEKLDAAVRQHQRKLDSEFHQRVNARVAEFIDATILPDWKQKIDTANKLYDKRKALMDKDTFNTIRRGLHPDSRASISDRKLGEAFDAFMALEKYLLNEKDSPTTFGAGLPRSYAEWEAAKLKATEARKAKRATSRRHLEA